MLFYLSVVVNIGSDSNFSTILYDLEKEISPLQKLKICPKDFKRTSVERYFRSNGFNLDWCSFKLVRKKSFILILHLKYNIQF